MTNKRPYFVKLFNYSEQPDGTLFFYTDESPQDSVENYYALYDGLWRPKFADVYEGNYYNNDICGAFLKRVMIPERKMGGYF